MAREARKGTRRSRTARPGRAEVLVDTSAAVALIVADHEGHEETLAAATGLRLGLAGHAWFETYSVLTRLPPGARRSPSDAHAMLVHDFPATRFLGPSAAAALTDELARIGVAGGSVYDAFVGATARAFAMTLISRDRRARTTYAALGVDVRLVA